jgi:hypothetical protein
MYRVLKDGGRVAISDIVSDEPVPKHLASNPDLWTACVSGAFLEEDFLRAFEDAKFYGIQIEDFQSQPYQTVEGIEFRSITLTAYKGKVGPCVERNQAVIYRGPFRKVEDDDGHTYFRGRRMAVCDRTFHLLQRSPYAGMFDPIEPHETVAASDAQAFDCHRAKVRDPRETKGANYRETTESVGPCCSGGGQCC